jgi:hypothetical protein
MQYDGSQGGYCPRRRHIGALAGRVRSCCGLGRVRLRMLLSKLEASEAELEKLAMIHFALAR